MFLRKNNKNKEIEVLESTPAPVIDDKELAEILDQGSYVSSDDIEKAQKYVQSRGVSLVDHLLSEQVVTKDLIGQSIAEYYGVPYADLNSNQPSRESVLQIPEDVAKHFRVVWFDGNDKEVVVATDMTPDDSTIEALRSVFPKKKLNIAYSLSEDIEQIFFYYQHSLEDRLAQINKETDQIAPEIIKEIFIDAYSFKASDIHLEPHKDDVLIRFRVDGVLQVAGSLSSQYYQNILNWIKVQSNIPIDEHFTAQDGSMHYENGAAVFDVRTSIVPTVAGEKVVLRILASYVQGFALTELGLSESGKKMLEEAARKPFGMILVTGPTGSGKTTTLYATLKLLLKPEVNITTIEDPVEYKLKEANQIQVNSKSGLTFAKGLRSIVRQDPDIILVGEIRDDETAEIAVNAALTGHLLLSTFHANNAATAIPRLLDMQIEPFLLSSTLEIVMSQRLVRTVCDSCRYSVVRTKKDLSSHPKEVTKHFRGNKITFYEGKGCDVCGGTGYDGRTSIFEIIKITPEMKELILTNPSTDQVWSLASKQGAVSLFEDGLEKVKSGVTTLEELLRVAPPQH